MEYQINEEQRKNDIIASLMKGKYNFTLLNSCLESQGGYSVLFNVGFSRFNFISMCGGFFGEVKRTEGKKIYFNIFAEDIPKSVDDLIQLAKLPDDDITRLKGKDGYVSFKCGELKKEYISLLVGIFNKINNKKKTEEKVDRVRQGHDLYLLGIKNNLYKKKPLTPSNTKESKDIAESLLPFPFSSLEPTML